MSISSVVHFIGIYLRQSFLILVVLWCLIFHFWFYRFEASFHFLSWWVWPKVFINSCYLLKNQLLVSFIFSTVFSVSFYLFLLDLYNFFLLLTLAFVLFLVTSGVRFDCIFEVFWFPEAGLHYFDFPSWTAFVSSHRFWSLHFHFHLPLRYFLISLIFLHRPIF